MSQPIKKVGLSCAISSTFEIIAVVVVLPCVPATAIRFFDCCMIQASISALLIVLIPLASASFSSGLSAETAEE